MDKANSMKIHEQKKREFEDYIDSFSKSLIRTFSAQEDAIWDAAEMGSQYIATIGIFIKLFGDEDNGITLTKEQVDEVKRVQFGIRVESLDDGRLRYSIVNMEDIDANTDSGENLPTKVQP